jgi:hypothetical protein
VTQLNPNLPERERGSADEHRSADEIVADESNFHLSICEITTRNWGFKDVDEHLDVGLNAPSGEFIAQDNDKAILTAIE